MIYIYRPTASEGGRALEDMLNDLGTPARFTQGRLLRERFRADRDRIVCWGSQSPVQISADRVLNSVAPISKFTEAQTLQAAGVNTVKVSRVRPAAVPATRGEYPVNQQNLGEAGVRQLIQQLEGWLARHLPPAEVWLGRRSNHIGGTDILNPGASDYYSRKEEIVDEFRLHMLFGKSIRAGRKVPREDFQGTRSEWVRSFDGGWRINYTGFQSSRAQRELASAAVAALGLDFGAVDIGQRPDGSLLVFEVNRAPGIEGGTIEQYAEKISAWSKGQLQRGEEPVSAAA